MAAAFSRFCPRRGGRSNRASATRSTDEADRRPTAQWIFGLLPFRVAPVRHQHLCQPAAGRVAAFERQKQFLGLHVVGRVAAVQRELDKPHGDGQIILGQLGRFLVCCFGFLAVANADQMSPRNNSSQRTAGRSRGKHFIQRSDDFARPVLRRTQAMLSRGPGRRGARRTASWNSASALALSLRAIRRNPSRCEPSGSRDRFGRQRATASTLVALLAKRDTSPVSSKRARTAAPARGQLSPSATSPGFAEPSKAPANSAWSGGESFITWKALRYAAAAFSLCLPACCARPKAT